MLQLRFACAWQLPEQLAEHAVLQSGGFAVQLPWHCALHVDLHEAVHSSWLASDAHWLEQ